MLEEVIKYSRKIAFCTSTAQINHYIHNIGSKRGNYLCSACTTVTQPQTTSRYNSYSTRVHLVFSKNMYFWYAKKIFQVDIVLKDLLIRTCRKCEGKKYTEGVREELSYGIAPLQKKRF